MKKSLLVLSIFAATALAGCSESSGINAERKSLDVNIISKNLIKEENQSSTLYYSCKSTNTYSGYVETDYSGLGKLTYSDNTFDLINVANNRTIAFNLKSSSNYRVITDSNFGFFVLVKYDDNYALYDSLGNKVMNFDSIYSMSYVYLYTTKVGKYYYLTVDDDSKNYYFSYESGSPVQIDKIPSETTGDEPTLSVGDLFVPFNKVNLSQFNQNGYFVASESSDSVLVSTFSNSNVCQATFSIPRNAEYGIVGDKVIIQESFETSEYATEYDYIDNNHKYVTNTYSVEYMTGKKTQIEANYKINSITSFKDENDVYTLGIAKIQPIIKNKVLGSKQEFLMNSKLEFTQDVTGECLNQFKKLNNGYYYNTGTQILYDGSLAPVTYLSGTTVKFYSNLPEYMIIARGGKYGALTTNGVVVADVKYDSFVTGDGNMLIFKQGSNYYKISNGGNSVKQIGSSGDMNISGNVFKSNNLTSSQAYRVYNEYEDLINISSSDSYYSLPTYITISFPAFKYHGIVFTYRLDSATTKCVVVSDYSKLQVR